MKLIAQVKLQPTPVQAEALHQTMLAYNNAANFISEQAWMQKTFNAYDLHHATYYAVRERFGLAAQLAIRVIKDVADAYKLDNKAKRTFRKMGSATYDSRVLSWQLDGSQVNIWTVGSAPGGAGIKQGRQRIPFICGERQRRMLTTLQGEADLVYRVGAYYLHQPCNIVEDGSFDPDGWLGVDMGLVNLATDSDGNQYSSLPRGHRGGSHLLTLRKRRRRQRQRLQAKTTSSARRVLRRLSGREIL